MSTGRLHAGRRGAFNDRGATLVEYATVSALLLVVSLGALQFVGDSASEQAQSEANCISTRPPPDSCQVPTAALPTSTTTVPVSTTSTSSTTPSTIPSTVPLGSSSFTDVTLSDPDFLGGRTLDVNVSVVDAVGAPVAGAIVTFEIRYSDQDDAPYDPIIPIEQKTCTTDVTGTCNPPITFDIPGGEGIQYVEVNVVSITSTPEVTLPASGQAWDLTP